VLPLLRPFPPPPAPPGLPHRLESPFANVPPHPLARRAAEALQRELRTGEAAPGVDLASLDLPGRGQMFGVLVVSDSSGGAGYLSAFSGMLDGRWEVEGFAPPLFDPAERDAFWPACEEALRSFEQQLKALAGSPEAIALRERRVAEEARQTTEREALRSRHAENRRLRHDARLGLERETVGEDERRRALHALSQQSRADEVEQRKLATAHREARASLRSAEQALEARRLALESQRTERSRAAWRQLTEGYRLPNARGEEKTLAALFAPRPPPGGAGDCAAPKLLAQAYRQGLKPLALAEFWWGAPPLTGGFTPGAYFPACQAKCGQVLPWMMEGLEAERFKGAIPLEGGHSKEVFLVQAEGERAVLRVYRRDPDRALIDAALLRRVRGLIPAPEVLDVHAAADSPAFTLTTFLPGVRLENVLPRADEDLRGRLADSLVGVLARLSGTLFERAGLFTDAALHLSAELAPAGGLVAWLNQHAMASRLSSWPKRDLDALRDICAEAEALLGTVDRTCLVHGDFNGKNLLVDPSSGEVTAVLDWEFAHAGLPVSDLGNLLRFEQGSPWEAAVLARAQERLPVRGDDLLALARAADLWALIELAGRTGDNPIATRAEALLREIVR
jgi:tRNA pseudouridine32 synthase/23S rRNA pseudouridine746 synthase